MTYGQFLDRARSALIAASDAAGESAASGHASVAATVAARTHAYRQLIRLVDTLGGPTPFNVSVAVAEQVVNSKRRLGATGPSRLLGVGLRAAHVDLPTLIPAPAATAQDIGTVAPNLATAADNLGIAADLLAGHLGDPRRPARTPEGQAIAAGAGHGAAVADLARIAAGMIDVDRRLLGWFARGRPARTLRPVYAPAADRLRWWTRSPYPKLLRRITDSTSGESVLRLLETAPATERSTGPRPVASLRDVLHTLDTTRAWMQQHPHMTRLAHARAIAQLAVTITRGVAGSDPTAEADVASRWERIAKNLRNLRELGAGNRDHLVAELIAANDWLHRQLYTRQQARSAGTGGDPAWGKALSTLKGRLPAIAGQIDGAVGAATVQGQLCVPQAELDTSAPRRGVFMAKPSWRVAELSDLPVQKLRDNLQLAARRPVDREQAIRQALGDPAALASLAFTQPPNAVSEVGGSPQSGPGSAKPVVAPRGRRGRVRS